ncbi:hypothetical protein BHD05_12465 [Marisediminicola antarctica]|uniref:Uncharacterized protein n=1 Tax=Marisediminicola antarctica TaxID=674079 RepID=A0A7L5APR4_9MICO|nr:hypothetical protein BHD05_12465 [Marisediminicola antarctica]
MIDAGDLRDLMLQARWDGLVLVFQGIVAAVAERPWIAGVIVLVIVTASRKAWIRLLRYAGMSYYRGGMPD